MRAQGYGVTVELDGDLLVVKAENTVARGALGAQEREIQVSQLRGLTYTGATAFKNGQLAIVTDEGKTLVHFRRKQEPEMRAIFARLRSGAPPAASSDEAGQVVKPAPLAKAAPLSKRARRDLEKWQAEYDDITATLEAVRAFRGVDAAKAMQHGVILGREERLYLLIEDASCIEPRRAPGSYQSGSRGTSIRVAKGVSFWVGASRGTFVPGPENPTVIDIGSVSITNQRVLFRGPKQSREWQFAKLTGVQHSPDGSWTALPVTNREKTSGIGYGAEIADDVRLRLQLAIADYQDSRDAVYADLESQRQDLLAVRPADALPSAAGGAAAGTATPSQADLPAAAWFPDPTRVARLRWWDGHRWTEHTAE